ncbi:MAG: PKD domain-containing protein [Ginsengibacter sp.]
MIAGFGSCVDSVTKTVNVFGRPTAAFTTTSIASCKAPLVVNFKNVSSGESTYAWDFGDSATSNIENPYHTYLAEGNYTVKLVVTNAEGCTSGISKADYIKIKKPIVSLNSLPQKGCAPLTHRFTASINSVDTIVKYKWDFGDGNFSNDISPTHIYTIPGRYTVSLTFISSSGCIDSVKKENGILVGSKPQPNFSVIPLNACADKNINFSDETLGNPDEWLWSFGDGSSSSAQNPVHQYNDTGYFTIRLIATNNGCSDTIIVPEKVHISPPVAGFNYTQTCDKPGIIIFKDNSIGADLRIWDFGDGSTSTEVSPVHEYIKSGIYKVKLTVTNQTTGCSKTKTSEMRVIREVADFVLSSPVTCRNSPVNFTASNSTAANISLYTWKFGDGSSISNSSKSVSHQYSKASAFDITLIIKDINGCPDTIIKPLAVKVDGPTAVFNSSVPGICLNSIANFIDSSVSDGEHPIQQWQWNWGDGTSQIFTTPPYNHTYSSPGTYTVSLKVTDTKGCTDLQSKSKTIVVSKPVAAFTADTLSCTKGLVNFHNTSSGPSLNYSWNLDDNVISDKQNPSHLYGTEGYYTISLSIKDKYGCSSSVSKSNYIKIANPIADFAMSDSVSTCPPLVVDFTNLSVNYSKWQWDFGDGNTSQERNPSHFYSSVGTFNVMLTVYSAGGCSYQRTKKIKVDGPSGTISYTNLMGCKPLQTGFTAHTRNTVSFVWDFNDGTTIPTRDSIISHSYMSQGKYLPKIILEDSTGCKVPLKGKDSITVFGVKASFNHNGDKVCDSGKVNFSSASISNDLIVSYHWNFGDGSAYSQSNAFHNYSQSGLYPTSLKVSTQRGCIDSFYNPNPVKVDKSPDIKITGIAGACVPAAIKFSGILSNPDTSTVSWKWDFGNGNISTSQNPASQNYASAGGFKVNLVASSSNGCASTISKAVDIHPLPVLDVTKDHIVCSGASTTLQVSGAQTYQWSPSAFLSCTDCATPLSKPGSAITYQVKGISDKGCVSFDSISLSVKFPFRMTYSKKDTLCLGSSVQLNALGAEKYSWTPLSGLNNPSIGSPKASPASTTIYQVIGSDSIGCFKDTGYIPVRVYPIPVINAGGDRTVNVGRQIDIVPQISDDVTSVLWTPSTDIVANKYPGITIRPIQSIEYNVEVKNPGGCLARDKVSIYVLCNNANIFVPNTFSPNGDGNNDVFYPRGSGLFKITSIKVFSRWGEIVFQKSYFNANDASAGWDGTYKGEKLPAGVFVYVMEVICENNSSLVFKGNVALLK